MAQSIRTGTYLYQPATNDEYVIERIVHMKAGGYTITARTRAQRAFGVTECLTTWTDLELTQLVQRGTLQVLPA